MNIASDSDSGLQQLMGLEVSAVSFVRDYVELHFDGPELRALSDPLGVYGGADPGSGGVHRRGYEKASYGR